MAPSVTETVSQSADHIQEKVAALTTSNTTTTQPKEALTPAVQAPEAKNGETKQQAELKTGHKEPLKLSGALHHFEAFDVTPTIGREFVGVDLEKWLRAPNSDELIRDLAITSKYLSRPPEQL